MRSVLIPCILLAIAVPVMAEDAQSRASPDRFQLWDYCERMWLIVEVIAPSREEEGQRMKTDVEDIVRNRLWAAHLYNDSSHASTHLYVRIAWGKVAWSVDFEYRKTLHDLLATDEWDHATTWMDSWLGAHAKAGDILDRVSRMTDHFIVEYRRVNENACGS